MSGSITESRTNKSIKNAQIALLYYFINIVLQFFSRKFFIDYLGIEILGLSTTATNLLQFLNLAELGIGAAVGYSLYKPLADKNRQEIQEIVSVQGYFYRKIGFIVLGAAILLMCFFPLFFAKINFPLWYVYATFLILLGGSLAGYFFNYRQIVLVADQKEYKLTNSVQSVRVVKTLLQILCIVYLSYGYVWWLSLELVGTIVSVFTINYTLKKEYPWLQTSWKAGRQLKTKYTAIFTKTKQLFFHKMAGFVLTQTAPLIILGYTSLTMVGVYGNYMLIVGGVLTFLSAIFNNTNAGVGNLVTEGNKKHILRVFEELFSSRFLLVGTICYGVYTLASPFITLWVGEKYLFDNLVLALIVAILYINSIRGVVDSYLNAYGLYHDVWAPITEASLNIGLSILFGYFWGLPGILAGVLTSLVLIVFIWRPIFLFRCGFKEPFLSYLFLYIKHLFAVAVTYALIILLPNYITIDPSASYFQFLFYGFVTTGTFFLILGLLLYVTNQGMRDSVTRTMNILKRK